MRTPLAAAAALLLTACASVGPSPDDEVRRAASWMTGTFSSRAQHEADPDGYFDIRLVMVPVWTDRADGPWLYVEQAIAAREDAPYRQRVYRLRALEGGGVASEVHTLPGDPNRFAGTWREAAPLPGVAPESLVLREGCTVRLSPTADGAFEGGTEGEGCASDLRGAKYATTRIRLTEGLLEAWDRGWAEDGKQVWGPDAGPYRFVRVDPGPPR